MKPRWDPKNSRWEASLGSGAKRRWFRSKVEGEAGRELVLAKMRAFEDGPEPLRPGSLSEFIEMVWWPVVKARCQPNTVKTYKSVVNNDMDALQLLLLADLRLPVLQSWVGSFESLAAKTVCSKWGVLHSVLEMAAKMGKYPHRDHELVTVPRQARKKRRALNPAQVRKLLKVVEGRTVEGPYWAASHLGVRLNECLGLVPSDVRLYKDRAVVTLRRGRHAHGVSDRLKSKASGDERRLVIPREWGVKLLSWHKPGTLFLFTNRAGAPVQPARMAKEITAHCKTAKVPVVTFHDLRHACATNLRQAGVAESMIQDVLGHSTQAMTEDYFETRDNELLAAFSRLGSKG
ncbi:MAG: tyrosine-type recombinase/integrase [Armatimonadetes bacterium]|nr:tyrosine-type recombinase/integrase [Armatimonadota bacterium]